MVARVAAQAVAQAAASRRLEEEPVGGQEEDLPEEELPGEDFPGRLAATGVPGPLSFLPFVRRLCLRDQGGYQQTGPRPRRLYLLAAL